MAETESEKKIREAQEALDKKLDKLLNVTSSLLTRMDAADEEKAAEKEEKVKADAAARSARMDAEKEEFKKQDPAMCDADDEQEEKDTKKYMEEGESEDVAADKARSDRKARMDARKADADTEEAKKKEEVKSDEDDSSDDEKKKEEDKAMADAARSDAEIDAKILKALRQHNKDDTPAERSIKSDAQARADSAYNQLGLQAPPPMLGERSEAYRRRLLKGVQKHSPDWSGIDLNALRDDTLKIAETRIYADAQIAARNPQDLPEEGLIQIPLRDPVTGLVRYEFRGRNTFIKALKRPSSRVTGVITGRNVTTG